MHWLLFRIALSVIGVGYGVLPADPPKPVLISEADSTRAIALTSITMTKEPFSTTSSSPLNGSDPRTRISIFALNLSIQPGEDLSALTADAEDVNHRHYDLKVEHAGEVPGQQWMRQVILRLHDDLGDTGDVLVSITYRGVTSNRVRVAIGHLGGGPPDDPGSGPTPAPPYNIQGRLTSGGVAVGGISVTLSGSQSETVSTDSNGNYSLTVTAVGDYSITPTSNFYAFTPASKSFSNLSRSQSVDFNGVLKTYTLSGQITGDGNAPLENIALPMSSTNGLVSRFVMTGPDGRYTIPDLPASYSYVMFPYNSVIYSFPDQNIPNLDSDRTVNITGTRKLFTVSGVVADRSQNRIGGATVTLSGPFSRSVASDANGNYSFSELPAGNDYYLTPSKTDYIFEPQVQFINFLVNDHHADFTAVRTYRISGSVTDGNGRGLIGVTLILNGPQSGTQVTSGDGLYSFTVTTVGSYEVTPFKEQFFYTFTPSSRTFSLSEHQTANFTAALSPVTSPTYVLEFDGTAKLVDYGPFWPEGIDLGHFFWEFWAMPGDNADTRYLLSDGYGGSHALLFGFNMGNEPGRYNLFGNIWNGFQSTYFFSNEGPAPGEWGHVAVGWDGNNLITYFNGVPVGKQRFTGPRRSMGPLWGAGSLFIGGSDHQNTIGRIAQVRGYEGSNPHEISSEASFAPQTVFSLEGNLLSYYFRPSQNVADLSFGYDGAAHAGTLRGVPNGFQHPCPSCPGPTFVLDPTAPDFANPSNPGSIIAPVDSAPAPPNGARVFDSFSRANSTYLLGGRGGLGFTEGGSAGAQAWNSNADSSQPQPFGILNGKAVLLANDSGIAWVSTLSTNGNMEVQVWRRPTTSASGENTGLSFRVIDKNNYFFAYTSDDEVDPSRPKKLTVGYYQSGNRVILTSLVALPNEWTALRVLTQQSGSINVFADNTLLYTTSSNLMTDAGGAGLYNSRSNMGLSNRWDNFMVFDIP